MTYLVLLDDRHLDDLLFLPALGRLMAPAKRRVVLVHGSGGQAERLLEASGYFPDTQHGAFPRLDAPERPLVEGGVRRTNRTLVSTLTDALVPAVGFQGGDRGLLKQDEAGAVRGGKVGWLANLVEQGGVPVVSALVASPSGGVLVPPGTALAALAEAWREVEAVTAVVFTRRDRHGLGHPVVAEMDVSDLETHHEALSDAYAAQQVAQAGTPLLVTSPSAFFDGEAPSGTRIVTKKHD